MSIKISDSQSVVAHHIIDGPVVFPYKTDARSAVARYPGEWSMEPWSRDAEAKAREAAGQPVDELTPEEQAAIDEHAKAVAEANERLKAYWAKKAEEKKIADQVAADEALVNSAPPRPDPAIKRPFGRKGEPTKAELEQIKKREAKKSDDEQKKAGPDQTAAQAAAEKRARDEQNERDRIAVEQQKARDDKMVAAKSNEDQLASAAARGAPITG